MNVEGAEVERRTGPHGHAALPRGLEPGHIAGAALGIPMAALGVPLPLHVGARRLSSPWACWSGSGAPSCRRCRSRSTRPGSRSAWREPRTLAIGVMVLAFATVEGSANDWLSLAIIDGYDAAHWVGVLGYAVFVTAMTTGRLLGPVLLDRWGRAPVLWGTDGGGRGRASCWSWRRALVPGRPRHRGVGAGRLPGLPGRHECGRRRPGPGGRRVSVVSTIGYAAFLAGPPLLGQLGDRVGTLDSLLAVALLMAPAAATVFAARPVRAELPART